MKNAAPSPSTPDRRPHLLVTGARGGIGSACVARGRQDGWAVSSWDLPEVDVSNPEVVARALAEATSQHGPVDALIHTAGILEPDRALDPDWQRSIAINLGGVITTCSAVARHMCAQPADTRQAPHLPAIVVLSSNAATHPRIGMASYGASKAAATQWARTLGLECAPHGVRVNIVSPGSTDTPMLRATGGSHSPIAGSAEHFRLGIPLGRIADPQDIAGACFGLLSPDARHITLHDLRVDGGATLDS